MAKGAVWQGIRRVFLVPLRAATAVDWFWWGALAMVRADFPDAIHCFDRSLSLRPNDITTLHNKAECLLHSHRYEEALGCLDIALAVDSSDATAWRNRGRLYKLMGDFHQAKASFERAIAISPTNDQFRMEMAELLLQYRDVNEEQV